MRLLLFSDSHGTSGCLNDMLAQAKKEGRPDAVLFAGDGLAGLSGLDSLAPAYKVRGNCDPPDPNTPQEMTLTFGRHVVYLSHGNLHRVKRTLDLLAAEALRRGAAIAVYGHTHVQQAELVSRVFCVNPGALWNGEYALLHLSEDKLPKAEFRKLS